MRPSLAPGSKERLGVVGAAWVALRRAARPKPGPGLRRSAANVDVCPGDDRS